MLHRGSVVQGEYCTGEASIQKGEACSCWIFGCGFEKLVKLWETLQSLRGGQRKVQRLQNNVLWFDKVV